MTESDRAAMPTVFFLTDAEPGAAPAADFGDDFEVVLLPLPDGDDPASSVLSRIREHGSTRWLVAGHRRGAPVALAVAERALAGEPGIFGLAGVVVLDAAGPDAAGPDADAAPLDLPHLVASSGDDLASSMHAFWSTWAGTAPSLPADVCRTIASPRTSSRTRGILARRALADDPDYVPGVLTATQLGTLRAIADRAVPQTGPAIDLAARADAGLAAGASDGWRNAALPPDDEAYRAALDDLADLGSLSEGDRDRRLAAIVAGEWSAPQGRLTAEQLNLWFEDCRVDLVRLWLGHPATMTRIGFDGYANGGDLVRIQGFIQLGAGQREDWEPRMEGTR